MSKRKRGGQPGNLNALKHGFYLKQFRKRELSDLEKAGDLDEKIEMMRVVTRQDFMSERRTAQPDSH